VGHVNAGFIYAYGNSDWLPNSEMFYVGGANSLRAFPVRGVGPGRFPGYGDKAISYLMQNGDMKLQGNLEYRTRLTGNLEGAVFLDVGNVWDLYHDYDDEEINQELDYMNFHFGKSFKDLAVGTGVGLRYDLDFLVIRLDWGIGLHVPYDTGKSGFYNIRRFKDAQALHLAVGYPF
jgi:outer membrane protein assembly factor BamA